MTTQNDSMTETDDEAHGLTRRTAMLSGAALGVAGAAVSTFGVPMTAAEAAPSSFLDVSSRTLFAKEINWMRSKGITNGWQTSRGAVYRPLADIKRDAVAAFIYRLAGSPAYTPTGRVFKDVSTRTIFAKEIEWLHHVGLANGWSDGTYRPLADIKRDAVAAFLYRLAGSPSYTPTGKVFADVRKGDLFAREIEWLGKVGVANGWQTSRGKEFRPLANIKRDAVAAFLYRMSQKGLVKKQSNPYLSPVTSIAPVTGGKVLKSGWNGTRVRIIQKKLGIHRTGPRQTFDSATRSAVISFQRRKGLAADGVVGPKTWAKLAPEYPFTMDAWRTSVRSPITATPAQRIEEMIRFAKAQLGTPYTWGGAGWKNASVAGFDCSGLVLQAMYSAGLDPQPINVVKHAEPTYRTSAQLYAHKGLKSVPRSQMRKGDLVFFSRTSSGPVTHVALYLGGGQVIESWSTDCHIIGYSGGSTFHGSYYYAKPNVKRPFG